MDIDLCINENWYLATPGTEISPITINLSMTRRKITCFQDRIFGLDDKTKIGT